MNVFHLRARLVEDYGAYVRSFIAIRDNRISEQVESEFRSGRLWPEPLIQLKPAFAPGGSVEDLVAEGLLHDWPALLNQQPRVFGVMRAGRTSRMGLDSGLFPAEWQFFLAALEESGGSATDPGGDVSDSEKVVPRYVAELRAKGRAVCAVDVRDPSARDAARTLRAANRVAAAVDPTHPDTVGALRAALAPTS